MVLNVLIVVEVIVSVFFYQSISLYNVIRIRSCRSLDVACNLTHLQEFPLLLDIVR